MLRRKMFDRIPLAPEHIKLEHSRHPSRCAFGSSAIDRMPWTIASKAEPASGGTTRHQ
jgi:hypothetical protein